MGGRGGAEGAVAAAARGGRGEGRRGQQRGVSSAAHRPHAGIVRRASDELEENRVVLEPAALKPVLQVLRRDFRRRGERRDLRDDVQRRTGAVVDEDRRGGGGAVGGLEGGRRGEVGGRRVGERAPAAHVDRDRGPGLDRDDERCRRARRLPRRDRRGDEERLQHVERRRPPLPQLRAVAGGADGADRSEVEVVRRAIGRRPLVRQRAARRRRVVKVVEERRRAPHRRARREELGGRLVPQLLERLDGHRPHPEGDVVQEAVEGHPGDPIPDVALGDALGSGYQRVRVAVCTREGGRAEVSRWRRARGRWGARRAGRGAARRAHAGQSRASASACASWSSRR